MIKKFNIFVMEFISQFIMIDFTSHNIASTKKQQTEHPLQNQFIKQNYEKILSFSNLQLHQEISYRNVSIFQKEIIHEIYTINTDNIPHLVYVHGYGGTGVTGIKIFQQLFPFFRIHAIDLAGFGFSSSGNFSDDFTYDQAIQYYIKPLQEWRKTVQIQKFYMVGHSFGGYISAVYAFKYPERIENLILLSPAGVNPHQQYSYTSQKSCLKTMYLNFAEKVYNLNITPSSLAKSKILGNKFIETILKSKLKIPEYQQPYWRSYLKLINSQASNSEQGFYRIFEYPISPKLTIEEMIRKNKFQFEISFYFGEVDWMARDGADRIVKDGVKNVRVETVPRAGHQIIADNYRYICQSIKNKWKKQMLSGLDLCQILQRYKK